MLPATFSSSVVSPAVEMILDHSQLALGQLQPGWPLSYAPMPWADVVQANGLEQRPHIAFPRVVMHSAVSTPKQEPTSCCCA
jgi:hypothetical protein